MDRLDDTEGIVNCATYNNGKKIAEIDLFGPEQVEPGQFMWIGLHEPSEAIMQKLQTRFNLHDLAIEDAHKAHQRPKIEFYGNSIFIVIRTVRLNKNNSLHFGETHFFVGENFFITIRHGSSINYADVRKQCECTPELLGKGQGFALYAVMDFLVDQYFPVVHQLEQQLEVLEEKIFKAPSNKATTELIYLLKRDLIEIKLAVSPLIDICNRLMRFDIKFISDDLRPYFRDIYDHVLRVNEMIDTSRELLGTALDANFSLISISQNEVSKKFAAWAAIISIPSLVAGFFGMNFKFIPESDWGLGFYDALVISFCLCMLLYFLLRRAKWL